MASVPTLTKHAKIKEDDIILLNDKAFGYKKDGTVRAGTDIYSCHGSASRAK